jgi:vancomycin resistance protein VanJ
MHPAVRDWLTSRSKAFSMSNQGLHKDQTTGHTGSPGPVTPKDRRGPFRRLIRVFSWLYAASVLAVWMWVYGSSPESWLCHLFLYGPRWVLTLPLLLLAVPVTLTQQWRLAPVLGLATLVVASIWGFNVPWGNRPLDDGGEHAKLRLLTCNVQGSDLKPDELVDLVNNFRPDVMSLQECNRANPLAGRCGDGWYERGEGEYCLVSRYPIVDFEVLRRPDKSYRIVAVRAKVLWSGKKIPIVVVHLMSPRWGLEAVIHSPLGGINRFQGVAAEQRYESQLLRRWAEECSDSVLLAGDFNLTAEHPLYGRDWSDYANAFSQTAWGLGSTMFTQRIELRIDHILYGPDWRAVNCWVGPDVGSAHHPVVTEMSWIGPP